LTSKPNAQRSGGSPNSTGRNLSAWISIVSSPSVSDSRRLIRIRDGRQIEIFSRRTVDEAREALQPHALQ
jgi:hypothetical protein